MRIKKSEGLTDTEKFLSVLAEKTFLKLWSFPNPVRDDGDELCDLIAIFKNTIFIFFDRESQILKQSNKDPMVLWNRWKKKVIDDQTRTAYGAEKYLRRGSPIYLDKSKQVPLPLEFDCNTAQIFKFIIGHGVKEVIENASPDNITGSLAISYSQLDSSIDFPFYIKLERNNPIHVLDSSSLPIIFETLDTAFDFTNFYREKEIAVQSFDLLYCGEEDLLAHYFSNYDEEENKHFIGMRTGEFTSVVIEEGAWIDFQNSDQYRDKKRLEEISYLWDSLIQHTAEYAFSDTLSDQSKVWDVRNPILEMAKEPRFHRRALSEHINKVISNFPYPQHGGLNRHLALMPSFYEDQAYVFLQLFTENPGDYEAEYRPLRQEMLQIACGVARNKIHEFKKIIGIAIDAPKYAKNNSEDFILLECENWNEEDRQFFEEANKVFNFFATDNLVQTKKVVKEFPDVIGTRKKIGRNDPCPCGSGKKFKKCCMR